MKNAEKPFSAPNVFPFSCSGRIFCSHLFVHDCEIPVVIRRGEQNVLVVFVALFQFFEQPLPAFSHRFEIVCHYLPVDNHVGLGQSGLGVRYFKVFAGGGTRGGTGDYADATVRFFEGILHVLDVEIARVSQLGQKVVYVKACFDKIFSMIFPFSMRGTGVPLKISALQCSCAQYRLSAR